jgi:predicted transcriptional regulator
MHRVGEIIGHRAHPFLLDARMSVLDAARFLRKHRIGGAPIVDGHMLVGFCSERDIVYRIVAEERSPGETLVTEIMSRDVVVGSPKDSIQDCEHAMREAHVRHLPIVKDGEVVACISLRDVLQSELADSEVETESLKEYIRADVTFIPAPAGQGAQAGEAASCIAARADARPADP